MSRNQTERKWRRMIPEERRRAYHAVASYLVDCLTKNRKRLNIVRYLGDEIWEGFSVAETSITMPTIKPGSLEWAAWRKHLVATLPHRLEFFDHQGRKNLHRAEQVATERNLANQNLPLDNVLSTRREETVR
jgi:hypothetical protein